MSKFPASAVLSVPRCNLKAYWYLNLRSTIFQTFGHFYHSVWPTQKIDLCCIYHFLESSPTIDVSLWTLNNSATNTGRFLQSIGNYFFFFYIYNLHFQNKQFTVTRYFYISTYLWSHIESHYKKTYSWGTMGCVSFRGDLCMCKLFDWETFINEQKG